MVETITEIRLKKENDQNGAMLLKKFPGSKCKPGTSVD